MALNVAYRPLLILVWAAAVIPVYLLCFIEFVMGVGVGWDVPHRSNWPLYLLVLCLPVIGIAVSTGLAWLSVHLWGKPRWQRLSFPLAIGYVAGAGFLVWAAAFKHWIQ